MNNKVKVEIVRNIYPGSINGKAGCETFKMPKYNKQYMLDALELYKRTTGKNWRGKYVRYDKSCKTVF